jgi:hypothetical protein
MNIIERMINIVVNNRKANTDLDKTSKSLSNVDKETKKVNDSQKNLTDTVTKNGGAMKILNTLTGGLAGSFKNAYDASKLFIGGLNGIKGAIIATGIGALVVGVGLLISNWEKFSSLIGISTGQTEKQKEEQEKLNAAYRDATKNASETTGLLKTYLDIVKDVNQEEVKRVKALEEIKKLTAANVDFNLSSVEDIERIGLLVEAELKKINNLASQGTVFVSETAKQVIDENLKAIQEINDEFVKTNDKIENIRERNRKRNINYETAELRDLLESNNKLLEKRTQLEQINQSVFDFSAKQASKRLDLDVEKNKLLEQQNKKNKELLETEKRKLEAQQKAADEERQRLSRLQAILETVKRTNEALSSAVAETAADKRVKEVSKEFVEVERLFNQYEDLIKQQKEAATLAVSAEGREKLRLINEEINLNKQLFNQRAEQIKADIVDAEQNSLIRKDILELQIQSELLAIKGLSFERILLQQVIADKEFEILEKSYLDKIDLEKKYIADIEAERAGLGEDEVEKRLLLDTKLLALRRSLTDQEIELSNKRTEKETNDLLSRYAAEEELRIISLEMEQEYADAVALINQNLQGFLSVLQNEALIRSKDLRNAFLIIEKGLAIAQVWIDEARSSFAAKLNLAQTPIAIPGTSVPNPLFAKQAAFTAKAVAANKINAGIATATILAQTIASFNRGSGGGSGLGGSETAGAPQFNIVESSGNNQLAAALGAQQQQPINAYVVGSDVATQMALDRNRITNSTFLFWIPFIFMLIFL